LMPAAAAAASARRLSRCRMLCATRIAFWDKEVLLVRGFKRVGKHSEYSMRASRGRPGVQVNPLNPPFSRALISVYYSEVRCAFGDSGTTFREL
jgi:hypothetical protein